MTDLRVAFATTAVTATTERAPLHEKDARNGISRGTRGVPKWSLGTRKTNICREQVLRLRPAQRDFAQDDGFFEVKIYRRLPVTSEGEATRVELILRQPFDSASLAQGDVLPAMASPSGMAQDDGF